MTYEQELAVWEADRKEKWNVAFDYYYEYEEENYNDAAGYADREARAWERRYPRPERKSPVPQWDSYVKDYMLNKPLQAGYKPMPAPFRIGCQDLTYTKEGVRLSNDGGSRYINNPDNHFGLNAQPQQPKEGFATKEEAEKFASSRRHTSRSEIVVMPYLATKLPEKRYFIEWYVKTEPHIRKEQEFNINYSGITYPQGGFTSRPIAEAFCKAANQRWGDAPSIIHEIREVEVYPND